jgi:hypothetical protein
MNVSTKWQERIEALNETIPINDVAKALLEGAVDTERGLYSPATISRCESKM